MLLGHRSIFKWLRGATTTSPEVVADHRLPRTLDAVVPLDDLSQAEDRPEQHQEEALDLALAERA